MECTAISTRAVEALEKGKQTPWRIDGEVNLYVDEPAEQLAIERVSHRKHHRRKAQLEDWTAATSLRSRRTFRISVA